VKRRTGLAAVLGLPVAAALSPVGATGSGSTPVLRLGPGDRLHEAVAAAADGTRIELAAGLYEAQTALITQRRLTLRGVGGRVVLVAAGAHVEGKALMVVRGGDVQIEGIEFRGARVPDGNGAGIRFERGRLAVRRCAFFDNEMGLLTSNQPAAELMVEDCAFGQAPRHPGALHHLLYVGGIGRLQVSGSRFDGGWRGHLLKSRAARHLIRCNQFDDGPAGEASYQIDLPNAGLAWVVGNVLGQGTAPQNHTLLAYGAEGPMHADSALFVAHNTFINRSAHAARFVHHWPQRLPSGSVPILRNNLLLGEAAADSGGSRTDGNVGRPLAELDAAGDRPWRLRTDAAALPQVAAAGMARGESLSPQHEITLPIGMRALSPPSHWRPGAFQT
jgi:hypothetical protein